MPWEPFERGQTRNEDGPWGGAILWDVHHSSGARITVEVGSQFAAVTVTVQLPSRIQQARHFDDLLVAEEWYVRVRQELGEALDRQLSTVEQDLWNEMELAGDAASQSLVGASTPN